MCFHLVEAPLTLPWFPQNASKSTFCSLLPKWSDIFEWLRGLKKVGQRCYNRVFAFHKDLKNDLRNLWFEIAFHLFPYPSEKNVNAKNCLREPFWQQSNLCLNVIFYCGWYNRDLVHTHTYISLNFWDRTCQHFSQIVS